MRNHLKTSLGLCKWGNGHNWIWAKLPLVELSQVTARGGSPSTYLCRDRHDCIWKKLSRVKLSQVTPTRGLDDLQLILVERATIEYGRNCRGSSCPWTKLPWVELSLDEIAVGRFVLGLNCRGSSCPWTKLPWVELSLVNI